MSIPLKDLLKVSRPGLWLVFVWLYLWPTGGELQLLNSFTFWMGLLYCTFPLNLLVYGMNDMVDDDVDASNDRKGNYIYGAKLSKSSLHELPIYIGIMNIVGLLPIVYTVPSLLWYIISWLVGAIGINFIYNNRPFQLSRKCPFELPTMIAGHLLIPHLACRINGVSNPSFGSLVFHVLLLSRSHIWLEYVDMDVDIMSNKRTIAVVLGHKKTLIMVLFLTGMEAMVGFFLLESNVLGLFSLFGMIVFYISAEKEKSKKTDKLHVSVSQSLVGAVLMVYLWHAQVFR